MGTAREQFDNPILFQPITIRGVTIPNRIMVSPMCQYSSIDGFANDWHMVHLGSRAVGGAGLVMAEAAAVSAEGRISPEDLGIWDDDHVDMLGHIAAFLESQGSVPAIQLAHAGRKASQHRPWEGGGPLSQPEGAWTTIAPSPIPFDERHPAPAEMTINDIQRIVVAFGEAARRAREAGFKIIELHGAHGYLINEFLAPQSNQRNDQYGGSLENRVRFLQEIIQAVQREWPDEYPIFVRLSAVDWTEAGWAVDDTIDVVKAVTSMDIDLIDVSAGGNVAGVKIPLRPGYQAPFAADIREATGMKTAAVGLITEPKQAEALLQDGTADLIALARELLREPYWPMKAARALGHDLRWPSQYERAKPRD